MVTEVNFHSKRHWALFLASAERTPRWRVSAADPTPETCHAVLAALCSSWLTANQTVYSAIKKLGHNVTIRASRTGVAPGPTEPVYVVDVALHVMPAIAAILHSKTHLYSGYACHDSEAAAMAALMLPVEVPANSRQPIM